VGILLNGCSTGPSQSGVELHRFPLYLIRVALSGKTVHILGCKGKQVSDYIHSFDMARVFEEFARDPRPGEVYNLGGSANSITLLEAISRMEVLTGRKLNRTYPEHTRKGDRICYVSNLCKVRSHHPAWGITRDLREILDEMMTAELLQARGIGGIRSNHLYLAPSQDRIRSALPKNDSARTRGRTRTRRLA
jgi:CDP-paratose 2-epimerase